MRFSSSFRKIRPFFISVQRFSCGTLDVFLSAIYYTRSSALSWVIHCVVSVIYRDHCAQNILRKFLNIFTKYVYVRNDLYIPETTQ